MRLRQLLIIILIALIWTALQTHDVLADDGPGDWGADCSPAVANQYPAVDGGGGNGGIEYANASPNETFSWGDFNNDGNTGDMLITTQSVDDDGRRVFVREVIVAQWTMSCIIAASCDGGNAAEVVQANGGSDNNGGNGGNSGRSVNGNNNNGGNDDDNGGPVTNTGGGSEPWRRRCSTAPWINGIVLNGRGNSSSGSPYTDGASSGCSGPDDVPPGCNSVGVMVNGIQCYPNCVSGTADGSPACLDVLRNPYPRGMVSIPNVFTINGPFAAEGATIACPNPGGDFPLHINRSLRVLFEMDMVKLPQWNFDDRLWNIAKGIPNTAFGLVVEHTYETASFSTFSGDKPVIGPGINELLPAYLVKVGTWWKASVIREWDQYYWYFEYEEVKSSQNA
jgi:hypothetical protein